MDLKGIGCVWSGLNFGSGKRLVVVCCEDKIKLFSVIKSKDC
jgi:hypothetical protein